MASGRVFSSQRAAKGPADFAAGARVMASHRLKCRNSQCAFEGMMEAKSDQPFVKKAYIDKKKADMVKKGLAPTVPVMQIRCPKCGTRWRMRGDQLR
jgi:hypothetical protein